MRVVRIVARKTSRVEKPFEPAKRRRKALSSFLPFSLLSTTAVYYYCSSHLRGDFVHRVGRKRENEDDGETEMIHLAVLFASDGTFLCTIHHTLIYS